MAVSNVRTDEKHVDIWQRQPRMNLFQLHFYYEKNKKILELSGISNFSKKILLQSSF